MHQGFLFINKPKDCTSYDCVAHIKKIVGKGVKIGHAGTLDPFATGLLIIGIGRSATKHIDAFMSLDKEYAAQGKFGELTDTLDSTGSIIQTCDVADVSSKKILDALQALQPSYQQQPPIYSALRYEGERLYVLARKGKLSQQEINKITQEKVREVFLHKAELLVFDMPFFTVKVCVSHGTYVRSLINDIAEHVGSCATTYALERTAIGPITLNDTVDFLQLNTIEDIQKHVLSLSQIHEQFGIAL